MITFNLKKLNWLLYVKRRELNFFFKEVLN